MVGEIVGFVLAHHVRSCAVATTRINPWSHTGLAAVCGAERSYRPKHVSVGVHRPIRIIVVEAYEPLKECDSGLEPGGYKLKSINNSGSFATPS